MLECVLLTALALTAAPTAPDTVVVVPESMRAAIEPWIEYRRKQGHEIAVVLAEGDQNNIRANIATVTHPKSLKFVVLVGDCEKTPTFHPDAKVILRFSSEKTIASDNAYGDFDADGVPEAAVGRLPADTPTELKRLVERILAYEQSIDYTPWRRRVNFVAGIGGFGGMADMAIESATKSILCQAIPAAYSTSMTYASWRSPYCPAPSAFRQTTLDRFNEGCLFWVYLGHGHPWQVDNVQVPGAAYPILSCQDVRWLQASQGAPIALFLACYTGAFDASRDCLAEDMLRSRGGPVAVLCGSRVTMPYGMAVLGSGLLDESFVHRRETIGEVLLHAKRRAILDARDDARSRVIDSVARLLNNTGANLADERAEHVLLFNLLGDPLMRLRYPEHADVQVTGTARAGGQLTVVVDSPIESGEAVIELVVRRDRLTFSPAKRGNYEQADLVAIQREYLRANDTRLTSAVVEIPAASFEVPVTIPAGANGPCHIRVFIRGDETFAIGSADLDVAP
jgi:hypothetical protein